MDALNSMQNFLRSRPKTFKSVENAIEWRYVTMLYLHLEQNSCVFQALTYSIDKENLHCVIKVYIIPASKVKCVCQKMIVI